MNIRRIITEAINNSVMSQYASQLKNIIGNRGISTKSVANNQAASEHIMALNRFVYLVLDAIQNGAYTNEDIQGSVGTPAGTTQGYNGYYNSYDNTARRNYNSLNRGIGYLADKAGEMYDAVGLDKALNPILGGAMGAFNKGRNEVNNMVDNAMFNRDMNRNYGGGAAATNGRGMNGPVPRTLATLFNLDNYVFPSNPPVQYKQLYNQAAQINQQYNNILYSIQQVVDCYKILGNIRQEVINIIKAKNAQKQQQQQNQQGQQQQQQGQQQPSIPLTDEFKQAAAYVMKLDTRKFDNLIEKIETMSFNGNDDYKNFVLETVKNLQQTCEECKEAIQNNSVTNDDYQKTGITPLEYTLLQKNEKTSLDNMWRDYVYINQGTNSFLDSYDFIMDTFSGLYKLKDALYSMLYEGGTVEVHETPAGDANEPQEETPVNEPANNENPKSKELPRPDFSYYGQKLEEIYKNGEEINKIVKKIEDNALVDGKDYHDWDNDTIMCLTGLKTINSFVYLVINAINGNSIYEEDYLRTGIPPLTQLMSMDNTKGIQNDYSYENVFWNIYTKGSEKYKAFNYKPVYNLMWLLNGLHSTMNKMNVKEPKNKKR